MKRSSVLNADGTHDEGHEIRTSFGAWFEPAEDDIIRDIERRLAEWTHIPAHHAEGMQILRYENGQKYGSHWDERDPSEKDVPSVGSGPPRVATVLMYLSDVEEGGETAFPHSEWIDEEIQTAGIEYSECAKGGVAVKPRKGDALLFFGLKIDLQRLESFSLHTGCPVIKGTKWSATKWIHVQPFWKDVYNKNNNAALQEACKDTSESCKDWAASGECDKNAPFMIGISGKKSGKCMRSCHACCDPQDAQCLKNLEARQRRWQAAS